MNSCNETKTPLRLSQQSTSTLKVLEDVGTFFNTIKGINETQWNEECGTDVSILLNVVRTIEGQLCVLIATLEDINRFMWCRVWTPTYRLFVHNAICYDAQEGLAWVASTMFFIVTFSFVTILLRGAVFGIIEEEEEERPSCCQRLVQQQQQQCPCGSKQTEPNNPTVVVGDSSDTLAKDPKLGNMDLNIPKEDEED